MKLTLIAAALLTTAGVSTGAATNWLPELASKIANAGDVCDLSGTLPGKGAIGIRVAAPARQDPQPALTQGLPADPARLDQFLSSAQPVTLAQPVAEQTAADSFEQQLVNAALNAPRR